MWQVLQATACGPSKGKYFAWSNCAGIHPAVAWQSLHWPGSFGCQVSAGGRWQRAQSLRLAAGIIVWSKAALRTVRVAVRCPTWQDAQSSSGSSRWSSATEMCAAPAAFVAPGVKARGSWQSMHRLAGVPRKGAWQARQSVTISLCPGVTWPGINQRAGSKSAASVTATRPAPIAALVTVFTGHPAARGR